MKRFMAFLLCAFVATNVNAAGIVLSDTSVDEDYSSYDNSYEEEYVAPKTNARQSKGYIAQQVEPAIPSLLANDTSDPLFQVADNNFLSDTYVELVDEKLQFGQSIAYGINTNLVIHAKMHYQFDFSGEHENGFSATEFGGMYRMNHGSGNMKLIYDALFGLKVWGSSRVREPMYANSSYFAGLRMGRQFTGITLAGTIKSTWVFDKDRGLSYIDFIPETYFRFKYDWRAGLGFDLRKSTNTSLLPNQEWLDVKLLRQYGNTEYIARFGYEFDSNETLFGFDIKILF